MIEFLCSNAECRTKLEVGDELAGKKVRCPKCKTVCVAPGAGEQGGAAAGEEAGAEAVDAFLDGKRGKFQPFDVEEEIAHGGMGAVLLARDKALQREVAVKVIRPQVADSEEHRVRFLDEAQIAAQLEHPNIVPVHELGKNAEGDLYVTMKLVKGKSLGEILAGMKEGEVSRQGANARRGKQEAEADGSSGIPSGDSEDAGKDSGATMSLSDLLNIFLKICDGMAFAHSKGVIHRDLKPDNIMVGEFGEVQIMDWGLAKVISDQLSVISEGESESLPATTTGSVWSRFGGGKDSRTESLKPKPETESAIRRADTVRSVRTDSDVALTVDGQITGTPAYMPPEQAEGKLEMIDHRSDI